MQTMYSQKAAAATYTQQGREASVVSANPHELVRMMFEELQGLLDSFQYFRGAEHLEKRTKTANRAISILIGLSSTLDFEKGGKIAEDLSAIYDYSVRRIQAGLRADDQNAFAEIATLISEIGSAWTDIRQ